MVPLCSEPDIVRIVVDLSEEVIVHFDCQLLLGRMRRPEYSRVLKDVSDVFSKDSENTVGRCYHAFRLAIRALSIRVCFRRAPRAQRLRRTLSSNVAFKLTFVCNCRQEQMKTLFFQVHNH